jgi:hypothetical protein
MGASSLKCDNLFTLGDGWGSSDKCIRRIKLNVDVALTSKGAGRHRSRGEGFWVVRGDEDDEGLFVLGDEGLIALGEEGFFALREDDGGGNFFVLGVLVVVMSDIDPFLLFIDLGESALKLRMRTFLFGLLGEPTGECDL